MNPITSLHDIYKNKPVWIAGSDPTLSDYPDDFLDGKNSITLHMAYLKFPNATYRYFNEYDRISYLIKRDESILKKEIIVGYPFYSKTKELSDSVLKNFKTVWYLDNQDYPPNGDPTDIFTDVGVNAMKKWVYNSRDGKSNVYGSNGTCLHNAFYVALMMGANPINIIGCGFATVGDKDHFGEVEAIDQTMRPNTAPFSSYRGERMRRGYEAMLSACQKLGIKVNKYKNYQEVK